MADLGGPSGLDPVKPRLLEHLAVQFGLRLQPAAGTLPTGRLPTPSPA